MAGFRNPIVAGLTLVRQAIRSRNYVPGVSGWSINRDGSAEFADALVRGGLIAGTAPTQIYVGAAADLPPPLDTYLDVGIAWVSGNTMSYFGVLTELGVKYTEFGFVTEASNFIVPMFRNVEDVPDEGTMKFIGDSINRYWFDNARVKFTTCDNTHEGGAQFMVGTSTRYTDDASYGNPFISFNGKDAGQGIKDAFQATSGTVVYNAAAEALCTGYSVSADLKLGRRYKVYFSVHWDQNDSTGRGMLRIRKTNLAGSQLRTKTVVNGAANQRMCHEIEVEYEPTADETGAVFVLTMQRQTGAANIRVLDFGTSDPCYGRLIDITDNLWVRTI